MLFNPVITQTRVCPSGERYDWGASYSMKFFAPRPSPPDQSGCNSSRVPFPPENEFPTDNKPPRSPLSRNDSWKKSKSYKVPLISLFHF